MIPAIDIIYNMTSVCPHDCKVCCVDATHVTRRGDKVVIRTKGLTTTERVQRPGTTPSIYDFAARHLQERGLELSLEGKLAVIGHLDVPGVRLDISGGDPLSVSENLNVLRAANSELGRQNITLTATGAGMASVDLHEIVKLVGEFNFTYDSASLDDVADRPQTYAARNLVLGSRLAALGAYTRAEFPITRSTNSPDHIERLYMRLHQAQIQKLLLMRLFAVGRGGSVAEKTLSAAEYRTAISQLRKLEERWGSPTVKLQCALRHLEHDGAPHHNSGANPCDLVRESFGLTPKGILLASPWAINQHGEPLDEVFVLGNLATTPLSTILATPRVREMRERADSNFGACKIFAFQHSAMATPMDRLFDRADPLYRDVDESPSLAAE